MAAGPESKLTLAPTNLVLERFRDSTITGKNVHN